MLGKIKSDSRDAVIKLIEASKLKSGNMLVIGCSSSEVAGHKIGTDSSMEIAEAIFSGVSPVLKQNGIFLAAQCCEHLNRAIIVEKDAADKYNLCIVNAVPQPKAGGSFATTAYNNFEIPVAVEQIHAHAGIDIGGTLIGMHLKEVAVPIRLSITKIGEACIICAKTRPKFIGGSRAQYDESLI